MFPGIAGDSGVRIHVPPSLRTDAFFVRSGGGGGGGGGVSVHTQ